MTVTKTRGMLAGWSPMAREPAAGAPRWDRLLAALPIAVITGILVGPLFAGDLRPLQAGLFLLGIYILRVTWAAAQATWGAVCAEAPDPPPFVTVLIPARNEERVIATTIAQVAAQDYRAPGGEPLFEIVAIDDASTDDTGGILASLASHTAHLRILTRTAGDGGGKAAALNAALPLCRGEVIVVFDADILMGRDLLRTLIAALDPSVAGVQACGSTIANRTSSPPARMTSSRRSTR